MLFFSFLFVLVSCSDSALTADDFASILNRKGYRVEIDNKNTEFGNVTVVDADKGNIEFEFIVCSSSSYAAQAFSSAKSNVQNEGIESYYDVTEYSDYYRVLANSNLVIISKKGNTLLCCEAENNTYTEAEEIIEELGYSK